VSHPVTVPQIDIDAVTTCFRNSVRRARNEEEVRVWVSKCIEDEILKPLGIREVGRYEYLLVSGARVDALYGHVVVEFKAPGKLASQSDIQRAKEQVIRYIVHEAGSRMEWNRYLGVIVSDRIAFVRYDPRTGMWILRGPYDIRREVVIKLIEALRGLRRKPLDTDHLIKDFGPKSQVARELISQLYTKLLSSGSPRTKILFDDWMRLFKQATGYKPEELEELPELAKEYDLKGNVNYDALIFSIHTYYALLLKLIAAEIAYLYGAGKFYKSYIADLEDSYARGGVEGLRDALRELESGGIFRRLLRIENFLEGDYFSWYLDELDEKLGDAIARLVRALSDYEVATPQLEPEFARDLLKRLYQNLVPSDLRHRLGEYYTPDWLANLLLDEVGLSIDNLRRAGEEDHLKPLEIRVLDPACGSGTFLVLYISRLRKYAEEHFLLDTLLNYVLNNVVGYDLNPLAVLTARTNYLLAIADLLVYTSGTIEIPVYLADSIMVERRAGPYGDVYILKTVVGTFEIPTSIIKKGLLQKILAEISWSLENKYTREDFSRRVEYAYKLTQEEAAILARSYERLYKLEEEGKNRVWVSVIRNAFAPVLKDRFDYVVGNPPWVNWENLPEEYRKISRPLWDYYGMSKVVSTGAFKKDLAMLFLVRCFDLYLKPGGKLGFLIPFTLFKTQAGAGFRAFLARRTKVHVVHDLVTLYPFEGATNRTSAIVIEKICEVDTSKIPNNMRETCLKAFNNAYEENVRGIRHIIWINPSNKPIPTDKPLEDVLREVKRYEAVIMPIEYRNPESPWMQITPRVTNAVRKLLTGTQHYEAHSGVYVALNQIYYVQIKNETPDGMLIITNPPEPGAKKKVGQIEAIVEPDLIYPLLRGKDVKRWYAECKDRYVIIPHNPTTGKPYKPEDMKVEFPNTYSYLIQYKEELKKRSIKPFLSLREKIKKAKLEAERKKAEEELDKNFYIIDNIGTYTFAPYKVVWGAISGAISGKATSFEVAVVDTVNNRPVVPDHSVMLVPTNSLEEAYYLAGLMNSIIIRTVVASYSYEIGQYTHILKIIKIPKYDLNDNLHKKIAELSRRAHELAKCVYAERKPSYCMGINAEEDLRRVERELDLVVAQLFGLSEDDLREFERLMAILSGEELPVEEEVEVPEEPLVTVSNTLIRPNVESYVEVDVVNPSREEITFYYELPGRKGSFKLVEGRYRLPVPPLNPGSYGCALRYVWHGVEKVLEFTIEVSEETGPRRRRTLADLG
jgi:type II restriction/modification system DNA methylase subunit YeeA